MCHRRCQETGTQRPHGSEGRDPKGRTVYRKMLRDAGGGTGEGFPFRVGGDKEISQSRNREGAGEADREIPGARGQEEWTVKSQEGSSHLHGYNISNARGMAMKETQASKSSGLEHRGVSG